MADYTLSAKITGDASSFQKAVSSAEKAASSFEKRFESMGKSITSIGDRLSKYITLPAVGAATALAGVTLSKGWNRMTAIDNAKVKLEAIGNSAESVKEIMNNALASVKGTAYGMDEAATTAASAVAAGIKPGEKLQKYLTAVADAAGVAGRDMASMGSIFNKVATQGKATNEVLGQLAESNIPIYQYLADEIGCTKDKVVELASEGKIDLATFQKAVENHIGGAAKIMGSSTITGAISNINASISRIGENILGSADDATTFAGQILPILNQVSDKLKVVEDKAKIVGTVFGETFSLVQTFYTGNLDKIEETLAHSSDEAKNLYDKITPVLEKVKEFADSFSELSINAKLGFAGSAAAAGPLMTVIGKTISKTSAFSQTVGGAFSNVQKSIALVPDSFRTITGGVKGAIGDLKNLGSGMIQPILPAFQKTSGKISDVFSSLKTTMLSPFKNMSSVISNSFGNLIGNIGMKFPKLTGAIGALEANSRGMFGKIGTSITSLLGKAASFAPVFLKSMGIAGGIGVLVAGLGLLQSSFGDQIDEMLATVTLKGPELIGNLCNGIAGKIPDLMNQGGTLIYNLLGAITANLPAVITGGISIISALVSGLATQLPALIPAAVNMISTIVTSLASNAGDLLSSGMDLLNGLVEGILNALPDLISAVPEIISGFVNGIANNLPQIITTGMELLISLVTGLIDAIPQLVDTIPQIYSAFKTAFKATDWEGIGSNLLEGIKDGFLKVKESLINAVRDIVDRIKNLFNFKTTVSSNSDGSVSSSISTPQLARGTDYWQGGFAYMNEGGRGELTSLPNGAQVIPHDISVKYAKEAAHNNTSSNYLDVSALGDYIVAAVTAQGRQQADALKDGISGMRMTIGGREAGRFISDMGFVRG